MMPRDDEALVERALDVAAADLTANVPMIEAMIDTPPSTSGYSATCGRARSAKVRTPSSMTATAVTA